jgi:hypothetical protein
MTMDISQLASLPLAVPFPAKCRKEECLILWGQSKKGPESHPAHPWGFIRASSGTLQPTDRLGSTDLSVRRRVYYALLLTKG